MKTNGLGRIGVCTMKTSRLLENSGRSQTKNRLIGPLARQSVGRAEEGLKWPDDSMIRWPDYFLFPLCTSKQKGLAINRENPPKSYIIEIKAVSSFLGGRSRKNAGGKNEGIFHYVIENKWRKNVRNRPFHYVDEKKGGCSGLSIMSMKIKDVRRKPVTAYE